MNVSDNQSDFMDLTPLQNQKKQLEQILAMRQIQNAGFYREQTQRANANNQSRIGAQHKFEYIKFEEGTTNEEMKVAEQEDSVEYNEENQMPQLLQQEDDEDEPEEMDDSAQSNDSSNSGSEDEEDDQSPQKQDEQNPIDNSEIDKETEAVTEVPCVVGDYTDISQST